MPVGSALIRTLVALPEIRLRVAWLNDYTARRSLGLLAKELDGLCQQAEAAQPSAQEALLSVALLLAGLGPSPLRLALLEEAQARQLLCLQRLVQLGGEDPARGLSLDERPVPAYSQDRELSLGERRSLARRPSRGAFDRLLRDPHPLVIRQLLQHPALTEADALRLATRRPAWPEPLLELARAPQWLARPRLRHALVLNPGAPSWLTQPLVCTCNRVQLLEVSTSTELSGLLRLTARELLVRKPPSPFTSAPHLQ